MKIIILPNNGIGKPPVTMYVNDVSQICVAYDGANTLNVGTHAVPAAFPVHVNGATDAAYQQQQIANALASTSESPAVIMATSGLTWASITPNSASAGTSMNGTVIAGTGFNSATITNLQLNDGGGNIQGIGYWTVVSDNEIDVGYGISWPVAASTYTLCYSADGGTNWTACGTLNVEVTL